MRQTTNWINDTTDETERPPRRTRLLLAVAAVPWLIVIALLVLPGRVGGAGSAPPEGATAASEQHADHEGGPEDPGAPPDPRPGTGAASDDHRTGSDAAAREDSGDQPTPSPDPPGSLWLAEHRGAWRAAPGPEEAAALAVAIARAWLTGLGPRLDVDGVPVDAATRYAEHLVVEAVEQPAPEAAVVTLLAVVLEGSGELEARVRRLAVPLGWDVGGPRPAGPPWWLPGPILDPLEPATQEVDDDLDRLAAVEALDAAGFGDIEVHGLATTTGWPVVAQVTARTPTGERLDGPVWLRPHLDGYAVAGTTLQAPGGETEQEP